jgi:ABC-type transporter Mla MlaB component
MLRITVHESPTDLTLKLEGRLAGPSVEELAGWWTNNRDRWPKPVLCVDLTGVTSIDAAGRACLAVLHRQGAEFIAADCLMRAEVAEITQSPEINPTCTGVQPW